MTLQEFFTILATGVFKVKRKSTSEVGVVQDIKLYGKNQIKFSVLFPSSKFEVWFTSIPESVTRNCFSMEDLLPCDVTKEH